MKIDTRHPPAVAWIGSRYFDGGSWGPKEVPSHDRLGEFNAIQDGKKLDPLSCGPMSSGFFPISSRDHTLPILAELGRVG